jgi:hypothetical protein
MAYTRTEIEKNSQSQRDTLGIGHFGALNSTCRDSEGGDSDGGDRNSASVHSVYVHTTHTSTHTGAE